MTLLHQRLVEYTSQAMRMIFNDTTVSHQQTLEALEALRDEIDGWIDAVGEEIERGEGNDH